jgi:hypothetical protein
MKVSERMAEKRKYIGTLTVRYAIEAEDAHAARRLIQGVAASTRSTGVISRRGSDGDAEMTTVTSSVIASPAHVGSTIDPAYR